MISIKADCFRFNVQIIGSVQIIGHLSKSDFDIAK